MQILSIEATSQETGAALHHALSEFHPAVDFDGAEGKCSVSVALGKRSQGPEGVFAVLDEFLRARAPDLLVVTVDGHQ